MEFGQNIDAKYEKSRAKLKDSLDVLGGLENISLSAVGRVRNKAIEAGSMYGLSMVNSEEFENIPQEELKKYFGRELKTIKSAYSFGRESLGDKVTRDFLEELNFKAAPEVKDFGYGYRQTKMEIRDSKHTPVSADKVPEQMRNYTEKLSEKLQSNDKMELVETAISAYVDLVEIHPFYKGNGRTSRIVHSAILEKAGVPLPVLGDNDRREYYPLMEDTFVNGKNYAEGEMSPQKKMLHSYMMDKIRDSVDEVIEASK